MNEVNRFLEDGILQAIRNLLPVKSILRDSLQEEDDDAIQLNTTEEPVVSENTPVPVATDESSKEPEVSEAPVESLENPEKTELKALEVSETPRVVEVTKAPMPLDMATPVDMITPVATPVATPTPVAVATPVATPTPVQETLVIDTEKSVGFTGFDSVFGTTGEAEMTPMTEEGDDELKIIGDLEELNVDDIEELDKPPSMVTPLSADDYESL